MHTGRLKSLLKKLEDRNPSVRRTAAEKLSEGDERAIYPLIKALRDTNYGVQDAAMRSLMILKGEATAYMVIPLLRENAFLRNTALLILTEIGEDVVPLLNVLLRDRDDDVRKFAVDLIHDIGKCEYPEQLEELLKNDRNPNVRAAAAKVIGKLNYSKALPALLDALRDEEWVCFSALEAITTFNNKNIEKNIIELLDNDSEAIRFAAIEALGKVGTEKAAKHLVKHMSVCESFEKTEVLKSLVRIGKLPDTEDVYKNLLEILRSGDWDDHYIAVKGLTALKKSEATFEMLDVAGSYDLSVPDNDERVHFIKESVKSMGCSEYLTDILNTTDLKYRGLVIAIDIIGDLQCRSCAPRLIECLDDSFRDVSRSIITALGNIGDSRAVECLITNIENKDSHVRKAAIMALGKLEKEEAFDPLFRWLSEEEYQDIIDELVIALHKIDRVLFLSRINELNKSVLETVAQSSIYHDMELKC